MTEQEKKSVETIELTVENIEKAFEILNIEKAKKEEEKESSEEEIERESKETKEKVEGDGSHEKKETKKEEELEDDEDDEEKEMKKAMSEKEKELDDMKKAYELKKAGKKKEEKKEIKKEEKNEEMEKAISESIQPLLKPIQKLIEINKGLTDELSSTKEEIKKANDRIKALENQPLGRKSYTSQFIEKAFQENTDNGKKQLSMSQHKTEINNLLDNLTFEKGQMNELYANGISMYQSSGIMPEDVIRDLAIKHNIEIVR